MNSVPFEMGPIRPVDEADSLLIRTTRGCPWNRCTFCTLYDDMKFSIRSVPEIKKDILAAKAYFNGHPFETCFLQDGDSFVMRTKDLVEILDRFLSMSDIDQINFVLGRRLGYYRQLSDMENNIQYQFVEKQAQKIKQTAPDSFEELFHNLRIQVTQLSDLSFPISLSLTN